MRKCRGGLLLRSILRAAAPDGLFMVDEPGICGVALWLTAAAVIAVMLMLAFVGGVYLLLAS